ncbi:prolyl 4-hydroxylase subunit alpha-1-like [Planococcus citri]|uniref:prolyl 4-hydroxylase subunit alpha-1-like n=1 Tax=Planococcus citri TaxID=170843 RepID=UPI0031F853B5
MLKFHLLFASVFAIICRLDADLIFTSPIRTRALLSSVDLVIETIQEYIKTEKDRVKTLEGYLNDWEKEHNLYAENPELHLGNHISLFNFLYKLNTWWPYWQEETKKNSAESAIYKMRNSNTTWPTMEDMNGVMDSIINIQIIHGLEANSLVNGKFHDKFTNTKLDFGECLMMAQRCFETIHYKLCLQWSLSALQKYFTERVKDEEQLHKVLYYISYTSYISGEYDLAVESIEAYVKKKPDDESAKTLENIIHLNLPPDHKKSISKKVMEIFRNIKHLCNKQSTAVELSRVSYLRCRYNHKNSYYLKIAPLKEEILSLIPHISLYRDVLYDSEIKFLKEKSKKRLQEVVMDKDSDIVYDQVELATFEDHDYDEIARISHRVNDMTGSRLSSVNLFQLHKYNVGASFADYEEKKEHPDMGKYSTVFFHMTDVIKGGSTTFPELNIAVKAEKGTALVWFDDILQRTNNVIRHAVCTVAVGHNWTLTKRIFEKNRSKPGRRCGQK